ncbi:MAG: MraY family glycosyltransferase [Betaproteobacteria bacterium]
MTFPFALLTALVISMVLIPVMMRFASQLGMLDMPDPRKIHASPVPRVGGIGIVVGALASILLWLPVKGWLPSFVFGSIVLLVFGAWDDRRELGHYVKFIGQFIAATAIVYWGGLWVVHLPLFSFEIPAAIGKPFTAIAIVGMINAMNHSDGLDGLAGGESLLSLGCLAYLGYAAGGADLLIIAGAVIGGVFGFLRYNTHPARVFMGDSGSQFLGFSLAVLAVLLTQQVNPGLSMAIPALILGLPIIDILAVLAQRVHGRMNWFRATKNHIHHRLLALGYRHYQAVIIIYAVQAVFVFSAIAFSYESDVLVLGAYALGCALVFALLAVAERRGWRVRHDNRIHGLSRLVSLPVARKLARMPFLVVQTTLPVYLLFTSLRIGSVPADSGAAAVMMVGLTLAGILLYKSSSFAPTLIRLGVFSTGALLIYLVRHAAPEVYPNLAPVTFVYFVVLAIAIGATISLDTDAAFRTTPLDYLLVALVVAAAALARGKTGGIDLGAVIMQLVVLFYGCELIVNRSNRRWVGLLSLASLLSALVVILRFTNG